MTTSIHVRHRPVMNSRRVFLTGLGAVIALGAGAGIAQQAGRVYRIGVVSSSAKPSENHGFVLERLRELGWTEGRNLVVESRYVGPDRERLSAAIRELLDLRVDVVLVPASGETSQMVMNATKTIPIVFAMADDPVRLGLVRNIARPDRNITGVTSMNADLDPKRLELLKEILPFLKKVAVMWSPTDPSGAAVMGAVESAARSMKLSLEPLPVRHADELADAFADAKKSAAEAVAVLGTTVLLSHQRRIAELAAAERMPTISAWRQLPEFGGLVSYGPDLRVMFRRFAELGDKVLKGAKPADIPVERPTKYDLVINLKTAKAFGLRIPQPVLLRATRLIE